MVINNDGNITLYQNLGFHLFLYNKGDNLPLKYTILLKLDVMVSL